MPIDPSIMDGAQIAGAGGLGGAFRAFRSPKIPLKTSVATMFFGAVCSFYFTEIAVAAFIDKPTIGVGGPIGFLIGFVCMSIADGLIGLNWREIILRFVPGKANTGAEL